ncbi:CAMK family protein kinase [Tritrichomonas foetus]|uniref:CAMK family protein kinase n=1 Tax=Tritrichomonas foetus TaxID=1144522 RepID=A0A1J4JC60_9EUKA|nr:CAMK family protein kinase [Tritrichomonas foetus]|eukprot:OHS96249.1 CAMK family protein kinase [Tritrichomonas foetus]
MIDSKIFADLDSFSQYLPQTIGKYTFEQLIGKGGYSRVFLVRTEKYNIDFVAKVMPVGMVKHETTDIDFLRQLEHPNIIRMYDTFKKGKFIYCILEYCPNGSLHQYMSRYSVPKNEVLIYLFQELLLGLNYMHSKQIAHRDIKPSNILIDGYNRPKFIDFGISTKTEPGEFIGFFSCSKPFSSPEIVIEQEYDPIVSDIWSLGVTFYYMAVGSLPWPSKPQKAMLKSIEQGQYKIPKTVLPKIASLIRSMLHVNPKHRPNTQKLLQNSLFPQKQVLSIKFNIFPQGNSSIKEKAYLKKFISPTSKQHSKVFFILKKPAKRCNHRICTTDTMTHTMTSLDAFHADDSSEVNKMPLMLQFEENPDEY